MNELYILKTEQLNDKTKYEKARDMLSDFRKEKVSRIRDSENKLCSIGAGYLLSLGLKERGLKLNEKIDFSEKGKPFLKEHPEMHFNISHTQGAVICAFSDLPIGVDIEKIKDVDEKVVRKVLNSSEQSAYENATPPDRAKVFFEFWTRKEAFLKNIGIGITTDLKTIDTDFADRISGLNFYTLHNPNGYVLSVCTGAEMPKLTNIVL